MTTLLRYFPFLVHAKDDHGNIPLHVSIERSSVHIVNSCLDHDTTFPPYRGRIPILALCSTKGFQGIKILCTLLDHGLNPNETSNGCTSLEWIFSLPASNSSNPETITNIGLCVLLIRLYGGIVTKKLKHKVFKTFKRGTLSQRLKKVVFEPWSTQVTWISQYFQAVGLERLFPNKRIESRIIYEANKLVTLVKPISDSTFLKYKKMFSEAGILKLRSFLSSPASQKRRIHSV